MLIANYRTEMRINHYYVCKYESILIHVKAWSSTMLSSVSLTDIALCITPSMEAENSQ